MTKKGCYDGNDEGYLQVSSASSLLTTSVDTSLVEFFV